MNWEAIKNIYRRVLIYKNKIEYLGGDKYKLTSFRPTGKKLREREYQNEKQHGKYIGWYENGQKSWEAEYQNGKQHGKYIGWFSNGQKHWEIKFQNGKRTK